MNYRMYIVFHIVSGTWISYILWEPFSDSHSFKPLDRCSLRIPPKFASSIMFFVSIGIRVARVYYNEQSFLRALYRPVRLPHKKGTGREIFRMGHNARIEKGSRP